MNPLTTPWLEATIIGFAYLVLIIISLLIVSGKHNVKIFLSFKDFIPYFAVVVLFSSYVIGLSAHLVAQEIIACYFQGSTTPIAQISNLKQNLPEKDLIVLQNIFAILIMYRHLSVSTFFLTIVMPIFLHKKFNNKRITFSVFGLLLLLTILFKYSNNIQANIVTVYKGELFKKISVSNCCNKK